MSETNEVERRVADLEQGIGRWRWGSGVALVVAIVALLREPPMPHEPRLIDFAGAIYDATVDSDGAKRRNPDEQAVIEYGQHRRKFVADVWQVYESRK